MCEGACSCKHVYTRTWIYTCILTYYFKCRERARSFWTAKKTMKACPHIYKCIHAYLLISNAGSGCAASGPWRGRRKQRCGAIHARATCTVNWGGLYICVVKHVCECVFWILVAKTTCGEKWATCLLCVCFKTHRFHNKYPKHGLDTCCENYVWREMGNMLTLSLGGMYVGVLRHVCE